MRTLTTEELKFVSGGVILQASTTGANTANGNVQRNRTTQNTAGIGVTNSAANTISGSNIGSAASNTGNATIQPSLGLGIGASIVGAQINA